MKRLLISLAFGLFAFLPLNLEGNKPLKAQSLLKSCLNYPYDLGINLTQRRSGSYQIISTSIVDIKVDNANFISRGIREANLRAKSNISNFLKLTDNSNDLNIRDLGFPIRINGRTIRTNSQFKNKVKRT